MRRLTLILSDLYLPSQSGPAETGDSLPATREMPALESLLRFSDPPQQVGDWRAWLLAQLGRELDLTWLATPVALEARLDHVRLVDRGLLRLEESERENCREEFARIFGPQYRLHDGGDRTFILDGLPPAGMYMTDPARLLGSEIGPALPGRDAGELRRLWAEIEMWLHGAAFNSVRERAGKRAVSALWLWGARAAAMSRARAEPGRADVALYGGDPVIVELGRPVGGQARGIPKEWAQIDSAAPHAVLEFAALTGGPHESLQSLDAHWFAPAQSALLAGELAELELLANDHRFRIGPRSHWRFWRRGQSWLSRLGSPANPAKA